MTDDQRILNEVVSLRNCKIVNEECLNEIERIVNYLKSINKTYDCVLNIQGDEPFIDPKVVDKVIDNFIQDKLQC